MEGRSITIDKKLEGTKLEIILEGRLDTITAPHIRGRVKVISGWDYRVSL